MLSRFSLDSMDSTDLSKAGDYYLLSLKKQNPVTGEHTYVFRFKQHEYEDVLKCIDEKAGISERDYLNWGQAPFDCADARILSDIIRENFSL